MSQHNFSPEDVAYIYNLLRQGTVKWPGRAECLRLARKKVLVRRTKDGKPVFKYHWKCANPKCSKIWFRNEGDMEVDHVIEIGGVGSFDGDWNKMIAKVFARPVAEKLQCLCLVCHARKTRNYMNAAVQWVRKVR